MLRMGRRITIYGHTRSWILDTMVIRSVHVYVRYACIYGMLCTSLYSASSFAISNFPCALLEAPAACVYLANGVLKLLPYSEIVQCVATNYNTQYIYIIFS